MHLHQIVTQISLLSVYFTTGGLAVQTQPTPVRQVAPAYQKREKKVLKITDPTTGEEINVMGSSKTNTPPQSGSSSSRATPVTANVCITGNYWSQILLIILYCVVLQQKNCCVWRLDIVYPHLVKKLLLWNPVLIFVSCQRKERDSFSGQAIWQVYSTLRSQLLTQLCKRIVTVVQLGHLQGKNQFTAQQLA